MRKIIFSACLLLSVALMQSCNQEVQMDPAALQAKIDSLAAGKIEEATSKATSDCETRMATEVKAMADSIVHATQMANAAQ
jgi:low affinity Fe/Cu permease